MDIDELPDWVPTVDFEWTDPHTQKGAHQEASGTEVRYFVHYMQDRVSVDIYDVEDNTLIKSYTNSSEGHEEAERSMLDNLKMIMCLSRCVSREGLIDDAEKLLAR